VHELLGAAAQVPYPSWVNTGDNTWQLVAATFVGLMSLPALAVLYASLVQKKWAVNVLAMMFAGFSLVLIAWVLWNYKMGFGGPVQRSQSRDPEALLRQLPGPPGTDPQRRQ
jgi:ammonium transporter, Amt family